MREMTSNNSSSSIDPRSLAEGDFNTGYQAIKEERCSSKVYDWIFLLVVLRLMSGKIAIFVAIISKEKHFHRDLN